MSLSPERLLLLDCVGEFTATGATASEELLFALGSDPLLAEFERVPAALPAAEVLLVGSGLAEALRPYPRDLAAHLGPPGGDDEQLERAAEALVASDPVLLDERLEVEARCGVHFQAEGHLLIEARRLPVEGLAAPLRARWNTSRAPAKIVALANMACLDPWRPPSQVTEAYVLAPGAPEHPGSLRCALTGKRLPLAGEGPAWELDRRALDARRIWRLAAWLHRLEDARMYLSGGRHGLLEALASRRPQRR